MKKHQFYSPLIGLPHANTSRRVFLTQIGAATVTAAAPWLASNPARAALPDHPGDLSRWHALVDRWRDNNGLVHNGCNQAWAYQCELLPCFYGVSFQNYSERVIRTRFEDTDVVVHLWKGWCHKFPASILKNVARAAGIWGPSLAPQETEDFPGGAGAEVGIYRVRSDEWIMKAQARRSLDYSRFNMWAGAGYLPLIATGVVRQGDQKWYPAPELKAAINFKLSDPDNAENVMINTKDRYNYIKRAADKRPEDYYWCTEWLEKESYEKWAKARKNYSPKGKILDSYKLALDWEIVGKKGGRLTGTWKYKDGDENCTPLVGCVNK